MSSFITRTLLMLCLVAASAHGQMPLSGSISGSLSAGVYVATGHLSVDTGQTLVLDPGVIIKFDAGFRLTVNGTLLANGTASAPVVLTSFRDDAHGGDTNGDGPSMGTPGDWERVVFNPTSDASVLNHTIIRFCGTGNWWSVTLSSADITMTDCTIEKGTAHALDLSNNSAPTVTGCAFNEHTYAVRGVPIASVPGFVNNTASGNSVGDYLEVGSGILGQSITIGANNGVGPALVVPTSVTVSPGVTLTVGAGAILKFGSNVNMIVSGTLIANGSSGSPVVFTSLSDDAFGGDTNKDGAGPTVRWQRIRFGIGADASSLTHAIVRFAGAGNWWSLDLASADITLDACTVQEGTAPALYLNNNSFPTVTNCSFESSTIAVDQVPFAALPGFSNNTASGNSIGNYIRVVTSTMSSPLSITTANTIGGVLVISGPVSLQSSLDVGPGVIFKFMPGLAFTITGTLTTNGTATDPVVFTSITDDAHGGDTNMDGAGPPTRWQRLNFGSSSDASTLNHTTIRFAGTSNWWAVDLNAADITMDHCTIDECMAEGISFRSTSMPTITNTTISHCTVAMIDVPVNALANLRDNKAFANSVGNYARISTANVTGNVRIDTHNYPGDVLYCAVPLTVGSGNSLTIGPGVIIKMGINLTFTCGGSLHLAGTGMRPVVITSFTDDEVGGDTNNDGAATSGGDARWTRLLLGSSLTSAVLEHVILRFAGASNWWTIDGISSNVRYDSVRVDHALTQGFRISGAMGDVTNCVANQCGGAGFELVAGGAANYVHCTSYGNGGAGFARAASTTSTIRNSISWANGGGAYSGYSMTDVFNSDGGFAGVNGNIDLDPQFANPMLGDLDLTPGSPCLDIAAPGPAAALVVDAREAPRSLDGTLTGNLAPDMGAYELGAFTMAGNDPPRIGGGIAFDTAGPPGLFIFAGGILDAVDTIGSYGALTIGSRNTVLPIGVVNSGATFSFILPGNPILAGIDFGIQAIGVLATDTTKGNFTARYRAPFTP